MVTGRSWSAPGSGTSAITAGIKGKGEDGQAGTREVKVAIVGTYRRLNRHGRPVRDPGCESHLVSPKQGLYIGSGPIEAACRTDVARRCKQAGMHWRFQNAASICALTARFRSHLPAA